MFIFLLLGFAVQATPIKSIVVPEKLFLKYAYNYHLSARKGSTELEKKTVDCVAHVVSKNDNHPLFSELKNKILKASFKRENADVYLKNALLTDSFHKITAEECMLAAKKKLEKKNRLK